jgi:hypothetical protein
MAQISNQFIDKSTTNIFMSLKFLFYPTIIFNPLAADTNVYSVDIQPLATTSMGPQSVMYGAANPNQICRISINVIPLKFGCYSKLSDLAQISVKSGQLIRGGTLVIANAQMGSGQKTTFTEIVLVSQGESIIAAAGGFEPIKISFDGKQQHTSSLSSYTNLGIALYAVL